MRLARFKRVYTEPWTVRQAWIYVWGWGALASWLLISLAIKLVEAGPVRWLWLACTLVALCLQTVMSKWSIEGLLWRKAKDEAARIDNQFVAIVDEAYRGR